MPVSAISSPRLSSKCIPLTCPAACLEMTPRRWLSSGHSLSVPLTFHHISLIGENQGFLSGCPQFPSERLSISPRHQGTWCGFSCARVQLMEIIWGGTRKVLNLTCLLHGTTLLKSHHQRAILLSKHCSKNPSNILQKASTDGESYRTALCIFTLYIYII